MRAVLLKLFPRFKIDHLLNTTGISNHLIVLAISSALFQTEFDPLPLTVYHDVFSRLSLGRASELSLSYQF
ncbi:hypothetical protein [Pseudoalteromonas sp. A757]|uniref:hypothetical protein n=1 Tax=Pseudoalteromonas sp. A757 TaxID=2250709 RepID=UPI00195F6CB1|nr:hypothetical protein [Pseudoalteromonas sp. A757]